MAFSIIGLEAALLSLRVLRMHASEADGSAGNVSDVNKIEFLRLRPRSPEVNKGTWQILSK